ncbi:histidine kinase [Danxiaibacter flavus]|uniref:Histidine kinase n=1 Tax=Danxiaibacter flavus TaxID=3049108 RepID=A0ABV3ZA82_9BACT|nr:histidine kinase [Chitinophagaceae bacterium DXS]
MNTLTASSQKRLLLINAIWWTTISIIHAIALTNFELTNVQVITDSLISNVLLSAGCLLIFNNMKYYLPRREKYWYVLIVGIGISSVWLCISRLILVHLFPDDEHYLTLYSKSLPIRFAIAFSMVSCMAFISLLWYTQEEQKRIDARNAEAERLTREAELFKLRQQLQPHFLFNSLNSISALTGMQPEKARHMIQQLSDFLRGTLRRDDQQLTNLSEELEYLQLYLDIEKVRFGYRLQTELKHDEASLQMKIPPLLLQPVVENAIKFGLYDTVGEVIIRINAASENGHLVISVSNPFDPETSQPLQGTGFGLASIKRRLFLLYARQDLLQTEKHNDTFITTIVVPQMSENGELRIENL